MGPTILLDKSALQALSAQELEFLYRYYNLNIAPVLVVEILGDLMKPDKEGNLTGKDVTQLANKLLQLNSAVNGHYRMLLINSLIGHRIRMEGRPIVLIDRLVESDGKRGTITSESVEEKAIHRWREGDFSEAEKILSQRWRESTRQHDPTTIADILKKFSVLLSNAKNFDQLVKIADLLFLPENVQSVILELTIDFFQISQTLASQIFYRWEQRQYSSVKEFAPYAFHCFRATLLYYLGVSRNYLTTRPTNNVDLEYVYYLPFTNIFVSRDKFHKTLVPPLLQPDQTFVDGDELKADLKVTAQEWSQLEESQRAGWLEKYGEYPPEREGSITATLWQKYLTLANTTIHEASARARTHQKREGKSNIIEEIRRAQEEGKTIVPTSDDDLDDANIDFIQRERMISINDPCPCGSGKKFKDCHLDQYTKSQKK